MTFWTNPRRSAGIVLSALAGIAASAGLAAADTVELRMATLAPSGSRWEKTLTEGGGKVEKATDGRVTVKYYADAAQGDEKDYIAKIDAGQLDGAAVTSVGLSMIEPSIKVLELPMMFASVEEMDYVRGKMWKTFQKRFKKKGYQLGDAGDVGPTYFLSANKVESLSDLKNQKLWRWSDDDVVEAMYKELGISGVPLGVPEVEANLTSGKVNACYGPPLAAMTLGWTPPKVKYMTSLPMAYAIGATVIKQSALDKISKDDQAAINKISKSIAKKLKKAVRKDNAESEKQLKRKGITVVTSPDTMITDFTKAAEAVWTKLAKKGLYSEGDLKKVLKYRDEYRKKKGG